MRPAGKYCRNVAILTTSRSTGTDAGMEGTRKITVEVAESLLGMAQSETGMGVSETVREGLKRLASARAQKKLLALRGKVKFSMTWQEMKEDNE